jgi:hypothetical protein
MAEILETLPYRRRTDRPLLRIRCQCGRAYVVCSWSRVGIQAQRFCNACKGNGSGR